jgi:hypothetical protein
LYVVAIALQPLDLSDVAGERDIVDRSGEFVLPRRLGGGASSCSSYAFNRAYYSWCDVWTYRIFSK